MGQGSIVVRLPGAGKSFAVVIAVLLASLSTFAIFTYVRGLEDRAFEDAELVQAFVAQDQIPAGTSAADASEAGLIGRSTAPRATLPEGAITQLDQIDGLVTRESVLEGEVLVLGRWVDPAQAVLRLQGPEGFEALSIQVGVPPGVAGFVSQGDQVSLVATVVGPTTTITDEDGTVTDEPGEVRSQYLLQRIEVLSVGQLVASEQGDNGVQQPSEQILLTVALQPSDVERAVFAIQNAELYFTLLPEDSEPAETPGRTLADLFE